MTPVPKSTKGAKPPARIRRKTTTTAKRLALSLDELRRQRQMTKKDFAKTVGSSVQYLSEVISCTGNPTIDTLASWAKRLRLKCFVCFVEEKLDGNSPPSEFMQQIIRSRFILSDIPEVLAESGAEQDRARDKTSAPDPMR